MNKVDCLLMQAPFWRQGILPHSDRHTAGEGILSIATFLKSKGYRIKVFFTDELFLTDIPDRGEDPFPFHKLEKVIRRADPKIVGIGPHTCQYPVSLKILELCKDINPEITTVIGGPHVTFLDKECLQESKNVDIVVRGEGEWTMLDIVDCILSKKDLKNIEGITYRKNDSIIRNVNRKPGKLEELPACDYSLVKEKYLERCNFFFTFTRGCPFRCVYCVESEFWGHKMRVRAVDKISKEINFLVSKYNQNDAFIGFLASMFNVPEYFFNHMCQKLKKIDFKDHTVAVLAHANHLPEEHIEIMKDAGITRILIAVESASEKVLKIMNKKITFNKVVEKCKLIKKHGLEAGTLWMFGHPGETPETATESLKAMVYLWENDLNMTQEVSIFNPYPGTAIYKNPEKYNLKILTRDWAKFSRLDEPVISLKGFPKPELQKYFKEARMTAQFWGAMRKYINSQEQIQDSLIKKIQGTRS